MDHTDAELGMKPTDREQKFTLLSWSTAVLTGLLGDFVGFWAAFFLPFFCDPVR
jgi:hypothetical protein